MTAVWIVIAVAALIAIQELVFIILDTIWPIVYHGISSEDLPDHIRQFARRGRRGCKLIITDAAGRLVMNLRKNYRREDPYVHITVLWGEHQAVGIERAMSGTLDHDVTCRAVVNGSECGLEITFGIASWNDGINAVSLCVVQILEVHRQDFAPFSLQVKGNMIPDDSEEDGILRPDAVNNILYKPWGRPYLRWHTFYPGRMARNLGGCVRRTVAWLFGRRRL